MASLAQKLNLKPGQLICLLEATPETAQVVRAACDEALGDDATISETLDGAPFDMIFYWPRGLEGLAGRFAALQRQIVSNGAIWVVIPKKAVAQRRGLTLTWEEMQAAAEYFGAIKWTPWVRVVETNTVPKMKSNGGIWVPIEGEGAGKEPIGVRVIETPENVEFTEVFRSPRSGVIAYVPVGAIKKGEALVKTGGNGKTIACGECHGPDLLGMGPVPGIAGRSPSYLGRELYDMQAGTRNGEWTQLMKPVVAKLTSEDLVNILAYVSSRPVAPAANATK